MINAVFPLRSRGNKLDLHAVMKQSRTGFLLIEVCRLGHNGRYPHWARLFDAHDRATELLPYLRHARIVKVNYALVIAGTEEHFRGSKSKAEPHRQSWFCARTHEEGVAVLQHIASARPPAHDLDHDILY